MRRYIEQLLNEGRVHVVDREVSGRHELAAVTASVQKISDQPVLFRRVAGADMQVISNVYGSRRRLSDLIGAGDGSFCRRWRELLRGPVVPPVAGAADDLEDCRLGQLPQITYFEKDAGATDAAYGLDKPFALVALNRQPILRVGGLVPGSKDRYARIERQPGEVFVVAAADVELLARSADDYAKPPRDPVPPAMTETPKP